MAARKSLLVVLLIAVAAWSCVPRHTVHWTIEGTDGSLNGVAVPPASYGFEVSDHDEDGFCFVSRPLEDPVVAVDALFERYSTKMADLGWGVQGAARPAEAGHAYRRLCQFFRADHPDNAYGWAVTWGSGFDLPSVEAWVKPASPTGPARVHLHIEPGWGRNVM